MPSPWNIITTNSIYSVLLGDVKGQVNNAGLTKLINLLTYLNSIAQPGTTISLADLQYMKILNNEVVGFMPNTNTVGNLPQTFDWGSINTTYVTDLADELEANI